MKFAFPLFHSRKQPKLIPDEKVLVEASKLAHLRLEQYMEMVTKDKPNKEGAA